MSRLVLALLAAVAAAPAAASAAELRPLVDAAPRESARGHAPALRAAAPRALLARGRVYRTRDGHTVTVYVSPRYRNRGVARTYVDFLGRLPHRSELGRLRLAIRTPLEVQGTCGGEPGTLACYLIGSNLMVVPGQPVDPRYGVTVSSLMTHEYGHHVAMHRSNAPFHAIDHGPKRWASRRRVCHHARERRVFPGAQGRNYRRNPGEAWADTYVRLKYPRARPWRYSRLLRPTRGALAAARADVRNPWRTRLARTWTGALGGAAGDLWRERFRLRLDGPLTVSLTGTDGAEMDVAVSIDGRRVATSDEPGSRDVLRVRAACRRRATARVAVSVLGRSGEGPFTVTARYAG